MELDDVNISYDQSSQWQKLAKRPEPAFEADMADAAWQPSTVGLIERHAARERGP
jgi:hypothetical protein